MPRITAGSVYPVGIFILVALTAAGLIIGAVYFASTRGEQARRDEAQEIARQIEDESKEQQPSNTGGSTTNSSNDEQEDETQGDSQKDAAKELPSTGVKENVSQLIAVSVLSLSIALYIGSRRRSLS